jgi:hypothetical protein
MRTLTVAVTLVIAGSSFGQSVRVPKHPGGPGADSEYAQDYNTNNQVTFTGTVTGKIKGTPTDGRSESMSILVKNSRGHVYSVDLGPTWYVQDQVAKINMGDHVKVVGSPIRFQNHENVVLAKTIVDHRKVLALRDDRGEPYWVAFRKGHVTVPGANHSLTGTIVGTSPVTANNVQMEGLQLQTPDGLENIALAPNWYLQEEGIGFRVGDNATIYYGPGPVRFNNAIIASGLYSPSYSGTFVFQQNGSPVWGR